MRYPLWAFFFVLVMPPFTFHALMTGQAALIAPARPIEIASFSAAQDAVYWSHTVIAQ